MDCPLTGVGPDVYGLDLTNAGGEPDPIPNPGAWTLIGIAGTIAFWRRRHFR